MKRKRNARRHAADAFPFIRHQRRVTTGGGGGGTGGRRFDFRANMGRVAPSPSNCVCACVSVCVLCGHRMGNSNRKHRHPPNGRQRDVEWNDRSNTDGRCLCYCCALCVVLCTCVSGFRVCPLALSLSLSLSRFLFCDRSRDAPKRIPARVLGGPLVGSERKRIVSRGPFRCDLLFMHWIRVHAITVVLDDDAAAARATVAMFAVQPFAAHIQLPLSRSRKQRVV